MGCILGIPAQNASHKVLMFAEYLVNCRRICMGRLKNQQLSPPKRPHHGQARVYHPAEKRYIYLGPFGSAVADQKFRQLAAEYVRNPFAAVKRDSDLVMSHLLIGYLDHLKATDASPNVIDIAQRASKSLSGMYGHESVDRFGPSQLAAWCATLAKPDPEFGRPRALGKSTIMRFAKVVIRAYHWAVSVDLVKTNETRLADLERTNPLLHCPTAKASVKRKPPEPAHVAAILPELTPTLKAAVQIQCLTGMRSGELLSMRPRDLARSGAVRLVTGQVIDLDRETEEARERGEIDQTEAIWIYVPDSHKTEHHGHFRAVPILPAVQRILETLPPRSQDAYYFSPSESMEQFRAIQRERRKSKVQPSQRDRRRYRPRKSPGDQYSSPDFCKTIRRACERAGVPVWTPHCLRHAAGAKIADSEGNIRGSQAMLGHASPRTTEGYARLSFRGAVSAAAKLVG